MGTKNAEWKLFQSQNEHSYTVSCVIDWVYLYNIPFFEIYPTNPLTSNDIWFEQEAIDPSFKWISFVQFFDIDTQTVTENSLDILHTSEVHKFGNKEIPLLISTHTKSINEEHALPYSV